MKRIFIVTVAFVLLPHLLQAQTKGDSIEVRKHWYGYRLYLDNKAIKTFRKLTNVMRPDPLASGILKKAKRAHAIGISFYCAGLATLAGYDIYLFNRLHNNSAANINQGYAYAALGLAVLSLPFDFSSRHNMKRAIKVYNDGLHKAGCQWRRPKCYLSFSGRAIGLTVIPY